MAKSNGGNRRGSGKSGPHRASTSIGKKTQAPGNSEARSNPQSTPTDVTMDVDPAPATPQGSDSRTSTTQIQLPSKVTFISLSAEIKASRAPIETLKTQLTAVLDQLWRVDNTIQVAQYRSPDYGTVLKEGDPLPKLVKELQEYFGGVRTKPGGGRTFADIRIVHTMDWDDIRTDARAYLTAINATVWEKALQQPDTRRACFLEGFPAEIDCHEWTAWFNEMLPAYLQKLKGMTTVEGKPLQCALRMSPTKTDKIFTKGQKNTNPRAPHVDMIDSQTTIGKDIIRHILKGPEIKLRINNTIQLVPILENPKSWRVAKGMQLQKTKTYILQAIQNLGNKHVCMAQVATADFGPIDHKHDQLPKTLRQMLLEQKTTVGDKTHHLFAAIEKDYSGSHTVTIYRNVEQQARDFLAASALYLAHQYGPQVNTYFSTEGRYRMEDYEWDETTNMPVSKEDAAMAQTNNSLPDWVDMSLADKLKDKDYTRPDGKKVGFKATTSNEQFDITNVEDTRSFYTERERRAKPTDTAVDDSTIASKAATGTDRANDEQRSTGDDVSELSGGTWQTKLTHLESKLEETTTKFETRLSEQSTQYQQVCGQLSVMADLLRQLATPTTGNTAIPTGQEPDATTQIQTGGHPDGRHNQAVSAASGPQANAEGGTLAAEGG